MGGRFQRGVRTVKAMKRGSKQGLLVRYLFLGKPTPAIAEALEVSEKTVRNWAALPSVQQQLEQYEAEQFAKLDRRMPFLLTKTIKILIKGLKRGEWKAADAILRDTGLLGRMMEHYLGRIAVGSPSRTVGQPSVSVEVIDADTGMSDEVRAKSRELLQLMRKALPGTVAERVSPDIPARITAIHETNGTNGTGRHA